MLESLWIEDHIFGNFVFLIEGKPDCTHYVLETEDIFEVMEHTRKSPIEKIFGFLVETWLNSFKYFGLF